MALTQLAMVFHHSHPASALKVSPNSLTIEEGETGTATISGGTAPYTVETTTGSNITSSLGLDGVTVTVATTEQSSESGVVTVTDANNNTVTITITVTEPAEEVEGE